MDASEEKDMLREKLFGKRVALNQDNVDLNSQKIIEKLINFAGWEELKNIYVYKALKSKKEIETSGLIDWVRENYTKIEIIFAPTKKPPGPPVNNIYDLVIAPVLGFDRSGNRLGYGGGYYDRLLSQNKCIKTIGLAYSFCEVYKLPIEKHDRKLDKIITNKEII